MGYKVNQKTYFVEIASSGPIPELHCITGPIQKARVSEETIFQMVKNGRKVYLLGEPKELITLDFLMKKSLDGFKAPEVKVTPTPEKVEETTPEPTKSDLVENTEKDSSMMIDKVVNTPDWSNMSKAERKRLKREQRANAQSTTESTTDEVDESTEETAE